MSAEGHSCHKTGSVTATASGNMIFCSEQLHKHNWQNEDNRVFDLKATRVELETNPVFKSETSLGLAWKELTFHIKPTRVEPKTINKKSQRVKHQTCSEEAWRQSNIKAETYSGEAWCKPRVTAETYSGEAWCQPRVKTELTRVKLSEANRVLKLNLLGWSLMPTAC